MEFPVDNLPSMLDRIDTPDTLLDSLPDAAMLIDLDTDRVLSANFAASQLLGFDRVAPPKFGAIIGNALAQFVVFVEEVDYRGEAWTRDVQLHESKGAPLNCELRGKQVSGHRSLLLLVIADLNEQARRDQIVETNALHRAGVSEWKHAQAFFAELERQNQLILNAAGEGIYGVNAEGKTTFLNRAAQEMLGWTAEDLLGYDIHAKIHHHHLNGEIYHSHDCPIYRSFRFEQVNRIEDEVFWRKDGKPIRVEYVSTPIYDQNVLVGAVVIFRDITERKENERKLREALDQIEQLRDRLEQENAYLQEAISRERAHLDIVGNSPAIDQILRKIDAVAKTDATVFITGETGTGKALVASAIHKESGRSGRSLIHFKCGSVAPEAVEAELFGQVRGAFPGAMRDQPGKLELAHGGTLFLDDIEELPHEAQSRLLNALQTRTVIRLGDTRARSINVRVIASTALTAQRAIQDNSIREDLLYFLNVFPIECVPLRNRKEDIPLLAGHLLQISCNRYNRPVPIITQHTMRQLLDYHWPGNVGELRNVIERATIVSDGGKLNVDFLGQEGSRSGKQVRILTETQAQQLLRENLVACLRETNGRVSGPGGAAAILQLKPTTVYSRIKTMEIREEEWRDGT
jgi:PAS domain S-box-containing protein